MICFISENVIAISIAICFVSALIMIKLADASYLKNSSKGCEYKCDGCERERNGTGGYQPCCVNKIFNAAGDE